jgi:hypothetical protein
MLGILARTAKSRCRDLNTGVMREAAFTQTRLGSHQSLFNRA